MHILAWMLIFLSTAIMAEQLPKDLKWVTNDDDPEFASTEAITGGSLHLYIPSFPMTLRVVGPDSNGATRDLILDNQWGLLGTHPNTDKVIPALATHWAYGKDHKTVYYKLNPNARWSDGKPVTTDDFIFGLEFMRSKYIVAPWYNNHYTEDFDKIIKYDDLTLAIVAKKPRSNRELHYYNDISPQPRHFFKMDENWVKNYNWAIVPNTGPYQLENIDKGKSLTFKRVDNWWAKDLKYYRHRFNVDRVVVD
ncbi:MAG: ABC transporter substrate-binding protein, partial [Pseudomonadota bacterium]